VRKEEEEEDYCLLLYVLFVFVYMFGLVMVRSMGGRRPLGEGGACSGTGWLFLFCLSECSSNWYILLFLSESSLSRWSNCFCSCLYSAEMVRRCLRSAYNSAMSLSIRPYISACTFPSILCPLLPLYVP
jgi:hypothetical protein